VSRRAFPLLVAMLVALAGCSRGSTDARPTAAGPVAAASAGIAEAPASRGPAETAAADADDDAAEAADAAAAGVEAEASEALTAAGGPFLWRIEGAAPVYLFGTIHVPDERVLALHPAVEQAFVQSTAVYTEIPMDAGTQMGVMSKIMLPPDQTLSQIIGEPLFARIRKAVDRIIGARQPAAASMVPTLLQRMKPWAAMSQLSLLEFLPDILAGRQPLDAMLYARAQQEGKKVGALETPDEQIAVFESFSVKEQIRMLELTLDEMERVKPGDTTMTQQLIEAYLSGDMRVVAKVMEEAMTGDKALMARFQSIAIDKRNDHMTERILDLRKKEPATKFFFAVGTAHYAGKTGIVAQLEKAGLKVVRVSK
jgi:uncharacterized protein YbaP (TraB family)